MCGPQLIGTAIGGIFCMGASLDGMFIRFAEIVFAYAEGTPKVKQVYKLL